METIDIILYLWSLLIFALLLYLCFSFCSLKRKINNENSFLKIFNIYFLFVCILLSQSSIGFIGILLGFLFSINYKRKSSVLVVISIPAVFFLMMLNNNFSMRVMDTIHGISNMDVDNVNISSFALISNIFVIKMYLEQLYLVLDWGIIFLHIMILLVFYQVLKNMIILLG